MLILQWRVCLGGYVLIILILMFPAYVLYRMNSRRTADDPDKKDYPPGSLWLTPFTPIIWLVHWIILAPWSLLFGIFLVLFPFILILFRPIPDDDPIKRMIIKLGNGVLKLNAQLLIALGLRPKSSRFQS